MRLQVFSLRSVKNNDDYRVILFTKLFCVASAAGLTRNLAIFQMGDRPKHAPNRARLGDPSHWASQGPLVRGVEFAPLLFKEIPVVRGCAPRRPTNAAAAIQRKDRD